MSPAVRRAPVWRSLAPRLVLTAVLTTLGVGSGLLVLQLSVTAEAVGDVVSSALEPLFAGTSRCRDVHASQERGDVDILWYDAASLVPTDGAPPIEPAVARRLAAGERRVVQTRFTAPHGGGGALYMRLRGEGPCTLAMLRWHPPLDRRRVRVALFLGGLGLAGTLAGLLGLLLVVRPLLRRIRALAMAAEQVGVNGASIPQPGDAGDELTDIQSALSRAHGNIMADRAALSEHLAETAHDFRTPIASLQLALESLLDAEPQGSAPEPLVTALADAVYLEHLSDNLRLATRLERGLPLTASDPRPTDLGAVAQHVCSRVRLLAEQRGLQLEVAVPDDPVLVHASTILLERALNNLVHNAISHADPESGHIAVLVDRAGEGFVLTVVDDGPGVPPADVERLASRGYRGAGARQRSEQGEGIGLAIVAGVCESHGFELQFALEQPRGLRVRICGPVA